jgi:hypothetical protein
MSRGGLCAAGVALLSGLLAGCAREAKPVTPWLALLHDMTNFDAVARLDGVSARLHSSYARDWGNDDFRNYARPGPKGWQVMADLKGPGYVSRFWMTGFTKDHRVRFYFDGERNPRIDTTVHELCGRTFGPPLAANENLCWYSLVPIPYARRLVIMTEEGGATPETQPKVFYQVSEVPLPSAQAVESYPRAASPESQAALAAVSNAWNRLVSTADAPAAGLLTRTASCMLAPGETVTALEIEGPGMLRKLSVQPEYAKAGSASEAQAWLRNIVLRLHWDGLEAASVESPLGDFFGSFWCHTRLLSAYFGSTGSTFVSRLPMPFARAARLTLENQGGGPVTIAVAGEWQPLDGWDGAWGYLHAQWRRSGPDPDGRPHSVAGVRGRGKYVGCILGASSLDRSWWMLEGDDHIFVDGEASPSWRGTGLEDYFTGGWYYHNVLARPFHGLVFKSPYRTVQYRMHLGDPISFTNGLYMSFERGPDNRSRGWMESLAFYYLQAPAACGAPLPAPAYRRPPADPQLAPATVMIELGNYERFGDYAGARDYNEAFLETHPGYPYAEVLRLRQVAYRERLKGFAAARPEYERFAAATTNAAARAQAEALLWFHDGPSNALVGLSGNRRSRAFLDGALLGETRSDAGLELFRVMLSPGRHVLALQTFYQQYPDWVQAYVRGHGLTVMTTPDWKSAFAPQGNWSGPDCDDAAWEEAAAASKGPPEEPWVWVEPNAIADMQSAAKGIRMATAPGPGVVVFRRAFDVP